MIARFLAVSVIVLAGALATAGVDRAAAAETGSDVMDSPNVDVVKAAYAAFGAGNVPAVIAMLTPDVVWDSVGNPRDFPALGPRTGPDAVADYFKSVGTMLSFQSFTAKGFYPVGDLVFVLGHYDRTVIRTGKPANSDFVHVFTIRDGKIASYREFADTATLADAWRGD